MDDYKDAMQCQICYEFFDDGRRAPKMLPCGHTFCAENLDQLEFDGTIQCPTCRRHCRKDQLMKNFALIDLVQKFKQTQNAAHGAPDSKNKCDEHGENLSLFCRTDKTPICILCRDYGSHKGHDVNIATEEAIKVKSKVSVLLKKSEKRINDLEERKTEILAEIAKLRDHATDLGKIKDLSDGEMLQKSEKVHTLAGKIDYLIRISTSFGQNPEDFKIGTRVITHSLRAQKFNDKRGIIVSLEESGVDSVAEGRLFVKFNSGVMKSIKVENLKVDTVACPNKHPLVKTTTTSQRFRCDMCNRQLAYGANVFACRKCNYDQCETCYNDRSCEAAAPSEDDRTLPVQLMRRGKVTVGDTISIISGRTQSMNMLAELGIVKEDLIGKEVAIVEQKDRHVNVPTFNDLNVDGTLCRIVSVETYIPFESITYSVVGVRRLCATWLNESGTKIRAAVF